MMEQQRGSGRRWAIRPTALKATFVLGLLAASAAHTSSPPEASAKWEGAWVKVPGGQYKRTLYYGPWQCSRLYVSACQAKCNRADLALLGCMWLVDIKVDAEGNPVLLKAKAGGRLAVTHCCCSYLPTGDAAQRRKEWDATRDKFREEWAKEFGGWPVDGNKNPWPGHHIHDLARGGSPTADDNVIPARDDVHRKFTAAYEQCYKAGSQWSMPGPDKPYRD